jgi:hypothetical protein
VQSGDGSLASRPLVAAIERRLERLEIRIGTDRHRELVALLAGRVETLEERLDPLSSVDEQVTTLSEELRIQAGELDGSQALEAELVTGREELSRNHRSAAFVGLLSIISLATAGFAIALHFLG